MVPSRSLSKLTNQCFIAEYFIQTFGQGIDSPVRSDWYILKNTLGATFSFKVSPWLLTYIELLNLFQCGSPGLVVMGANSGSRGRVFESRHVLLY